MPASPLGPRGRARRPLQTICSEDSLFSGGQASEATGFWNASLWLMESCSLPRARLSLAKCLLQIKQGRRAQAELVGRRFCSRARRGRENTAGSPLNEKTGLFRFSLGEHSLDEFACLFFFSRNSQAARGELEALLPSARSCLGYNLLGPLAHRVRRQHFSGSVCSVIQRNRA